MIDPSIPLSGVAPQVDVAGALTRGMQLRNMFDLDAERQSRAQENLLRVQQLTQAQADSQALRDTVKRHINPAKGVVDLDAAADDLDSQGLVNVADALRKQTYAQRKDLAAGLTASADNQIKQWTIESQALQGIGDVPDTPGPDPNAGRTAALQHVKQQIAAAPALGKAFADELPDAYDKTTVDQLVARGTQHTAYLAKVKDAANAYNDFLDGKAKARNTLAQMLSAPTTKDRYAFQYQVAANGGFKADDLKPFPTPDQWTLQSPAEIAKMGTTPAQRATEANEAANTGLRSREVAVAEQRERRATQETINQKAAAERWKSAQFTALNKRIDAGVELPTGGTRDMRQDEIDAERLRIENGYRAQTGQALFGTADEVYAAWDAARGGGAPAAPAAAVPVTNQPAVAPARATDRQVSPPVKAQPAAAGGAAAPGKKSAADEAALERQGRDLMAKIRAADAAHNVTTATTLRRQLAALLNQ